MFFQILLGAIFFCIASQLKQMEEKITSSMDKSFRGKLASKDHHA
jgi:hypothetical protein